MENPFLTPEEQLPDTGLNLSPLGNDYLKTTIFWTKFLAILGFVLSGLMFLGYLALLIKTFNAVTIIAIIFTIALLSLYVIPTIYLFNFSKYAKLALEHNSNAYWETALKFQAKMYKFIGILIIVVIIIYAIIFICFGSLIISQYKSMTQFPSLRDHNAF